MWIHRTCEFEFTWPNVWMICSTPGSNATSSEMASLNPLAEVIILPLLCLGLLFFFFFSPDFCTPAHSWSVPMWSSLRASFCAEEFGVLRPNPDLTVATLENRVSENREGSHGWARSTAEEQKPCEKQEPQKRENRRDCNSKPWRNGEWSLTWQVWGS